MLTMPQSQLKISSFFNTPTTKTVSNSNFFKDDKLKADSESLSTPSKRSLVKDTENTSSVACDTHETKKPKLDTDNPVEEKALAKSELSNEEKSLVETNKQSAILKMLGAKTHGLVVNVGCSWLRALEAEFSKEYFTKMSQFVATERKKATVYPPPDQVFTWTKACEIKSVKVVILGQDPYHGPGQAHGLCFSVVPGVKPPPSLENIFKELKSDIEGFQHPGHGNLIGWANQGVLLLNACLTVQASKPNSHAGKGWEKFTDAVIQWLNNNLTGVVFMLWGAYAQKKGACINKKKHHVLTSVHPSPLSAHRGFLGCKHFSKCNALLQKDGKPVIDWSHLPRNE